MSLVVGMSATINRAGETWKRSSRWNCGVVAFDRFSMRLAALAQGSEKRFTWDETCKPDIVITL